MSTLKVSNINNESATSGGIQIDSSGAISGALPYPNRNLLYNGAMQVAQRGTSTAGITSSGYYTADRWNLGPVNQGTWTQTVESDAPSGSGFSNSLKILCTTADVSPASNDAITFQQKLEGFDVQRIRKGTSAAQPLTLSFWVKSNVTGTYVVNLYDPDNTRHVSAAYTIDSSATWERKIITLPADTSGTLDNDNNVSLWLFWWLGGGSDFTSGTLATSWESLTSANRAVGQTNLASATNNYWQITGVQLEVGDTATEFEHEPYAVTLAKCQRYYIHSMPLDYRIYAVWGYSPTVSITFPTTMRTNPVMTFSTTSSSSLGSIGYTATTTGAGIALNQTSNFTGVVVHLGSTTANAEL